MHFGLALLWGQVWFSQSRYWSFDLGLLPIHTPILVRVGRECSGQPKKQGKVKISAGVNPQGNRF